MTTDSDPEADGFTDPEADGFTDPEAVAADGGAADGDASLRLWLVERTYADDEFNIIVLVYATPDGTRFLKKELALHGPYDVRDTTAAIDVAPSEVGRVRDPAERERYRAEAARVSERNEPDDVI